MVRQFELVFILAILDISVLETSFKEHLEDLVVFSRAVAPVVIEVPIDRGVAIFIHVVWFSTCLQ